jgi:hypothetical protein
LVCLVAALHLVGGHWGVLQVVAWARMLEEYTGERGLIVGVKETFDGEHACEMCKKIAVEEGKEKQQQFPSTKLGQENLAKWFGMSPTRVLPPPAWQDDRGSARICQPVGHDTQWEGQPPVPPPKSIA